MLIHWRSLLTLGSIFWVVLCLTDIFGNRSYLYKHSINEPAHLDLHDSKRDLQKFLKGLFKFSWSLVIWNFSALIFSILLCYAIRSFCWLIFQQKFFKCPIFSRLISRPILSEPSDSTVITKIPIMIKTSTSRLSDSQLKIKPKIISDSSCPNLLPRRAQCQTLYKNLSFSRAQNEDHIKFNRHVENQCTKLREEIANLKANAVKDQALLSKRLENVVKEKKDLNKQLCFAQKENRAAKHQLEELLQEKGMLLKRLESVTKELKTNTKTKKIALAKLEEVTANLDSMKTQLEQVTRDKEILENKLKMLENEFEQLQQRLHSAESKFYNENAPVRDTVDQNGNSNTTQNLSASEMDIKNIEIKIKQLERNLDNFTASRTDLNLRSPDGESEISLSVRGNNSDTPNRTDEDTEGSDMHINYYPAFRYWSNRFRPLDNISERDTCSIDDCGEEFFSMDNFHTPKRIVSGSMAFRNFLKNLQTDRRYFSQSDILS